jgi:triacylglycerol esterase/lipase EstA (alpha/beta hydrolase family)
MVAVVAWLPLVLAVAAVGFTLATYVGAAHDRRRRPTSCPEDDDERALWPARVRAGARECALAALGVLGWPFALRAARVREPLDPTSRRPVVLVHDGPAHAASVLWLGARLRRDGWAVVCPLALAAPWRGVEHAAGRLGDAVDALRRGTGARAIDVVAHGRAGLAARVCLRTRGAAAGVARLITLGTPHQGTDALPWLGRLRVVAELRPGSDLLRRLSTADPVPARTDCIVVSSADDAVVVPPTAGYYPGAFNVEVRGVGHLGLLASGRVYELVRENLAAPLAPAVSGPAARA